MTDISTTRHLTDFEHDKWLLTKMTSTQSHQQQSSVQDYAHPDDYTMQTTETWDLLLVFSIYSCLCINVSSANDRQKNIIQRDQ